MKNSIVVVTLLLCSCADRGVADSAASIWEAADAIEKGASLSHCSAIIKTQAKALIVSSGATYGPAGVTDD